jgi:glycosyltransferase involved in cell wall biosynthesis
VTAAARHSAEPCVPGLGVPGLGGSGLSGVRIAVANWRDPWHPQAGGAERYAWEVARGLAGRGARVRFLTARAPGQARRDRRDGIDIIRLGGRFTVYPRVLAWLLAHRRSFDTVLDCQNGIPFFTPCVLPRDVPVLCVMHHVHSVQFGLYFPGWLARAGRWLEGPAARWAYRRHACVAVSPSTVTTMRERLGWTGDIYLIPNGAPVPGAPGPAGPAAVCPSSLVWVGRLVPHKRAELILPVAEQLAGRGITIDVVGRGPAAESLAARVDARGLAGAVRLRGFLPEPEKQALVAGSLLQLNTSRAEGWGLCVLEAAAAGVPTVAYDADGLRDAVRDGQTGWLVRDGELIEDVTRQAVKELSDPVRRAAISAACREWAAQLGWDRTVARMAGLISASIQNGTARAGRRGTWIVSAAEGPAPAEGVRPAEEAGLAGGPVLAEGPVLDVLLRRAPGAVLLRPATPLERLLGRPAGAEERPP